MKRPPFPTREDLIQGYTDLCRTSDGNSVPDESFWSYMLFDELVHEFPDVALSVMLEMINRIDLEDIVGDIAAGHLENLISRHGPAMIDEIEREALANPRFNDALGGVWKLDSDPEVWKRIEAVREKVW